MDSIKPNGRYGRGFTLVELLVVISIIALLVSILLPALNRARVQAQLVVCATQQRQILDGLHVYTSDNNGNLPPDISMNDNGTSVWWDFPNYLACHAPQPVGGSLGWQFAKILPSVDIWFCPLSTLSPKTEIVGRQGIVRSYQDIYLEPDVDNNTWVWMTYATLWRYGGCADMNLTANLPSFRGPGLQEADTVRSGRNSDLAIMDFVAFNNNAGRWWSGHPFERSVEGPIFHLGPQGDTGSDITEEIGSIDYNAGYVDGHVERFKTEGTDPQGQYMGRNMTLYFPRNW